MHISFTLHRLTLIALMLVVLASCKKKDAQKNTLSIVGFQWHSDGMPSPTGYPYYVQYHFTSETDVEKFGTYKIGENTDTNTLHFKYKIENTSDDQPIIHITGKDPFKGNIDISFIYDKKTQFLHLGTERYIRSK